ncbi:unnamed protein product [Medioppia subpectinata]|uniref:MARVEL domain-containing protein n=1 Tax=Medioppia subpectinata TaxID=1979941 RepID=A0A7R9KY79_9ACAR|nr:unnamed protein product [Medioppia subpectinata]CAG2112035.1 unnamed protein product [Medioppia subpectinata]
MPSTATVQVRQTTTTTTARASVLVINTGYLSTKLGIIKLLLLIFSLICFVLLLLDADKSSGYWYLPPEQFLVLVCFANWYTITIMLISALLSLGTACILPKTSFEFIFHFLGFVLFLIGGLWVAIGAFKHENRTVNIQVACILALICGILHLVHGIFSYRLCITN